MNAYFGSVLLIESIIICELSKKCFTKLINYTLFYFTQESQQPLQGKILIENAFTIHK